MGRYRVTIYKPFTLLQCDCSKNDHFAQHIVDIKIEAYYRMSLLPLHEANMHNRKPGQASLAGGKNRLG
jgi:hypothetical protein